MKITENFLRDDFHKEGAKDLNDCWEVMECVVNHTRVVPINSRALSIISVLGNYKPDCPQVNFAILDPKELPGEKLKMMPTTRGLTLQAMLEKGDYRFLYNDMALNTRMALMHNGKCLFVTEHLVAQKMCQIFGFKGKAFASPSYERELFLSRLFSKGVDAQAIIRSVPVLDACGNIQMENGTPKRVEKVFSLLSPKYVYIDQMCLKEIYDSLPKSLGKAECNHWSVNHFRTRIFIEFPDKAEEMSSHYRLSEKFIPGVLLETSDTGDCSVRVQMTWRREDSDRYSLFSSVEYKHVNLFKLKMVTDALETTVFSEFTKLPEALCELMATSFADPAWDLGNPSDADKNKKRVIKILENACNKIKLDDAVGKNAAAAIVEGLSAEIDGSIDYTAYDIATKIMFSPARIDGLHEVTLTKLAKCVAKAPYITYEVVKPAKKVVVVA